MSRHHFTIAVLVTAFTSICVSCPQAKAAITTAGAVAPDPLCDSNGIVTSQMRVGHSFQTEGWVWVTDGDTLTTEESSYVAYSTASKGSVYLTDSTWIAEYAVFLSPQFSCVSTIGLENSTWEVHSNMAMAQNDNGLVNVTLSSGSYWYVWAVTTIATDDDTEVNITLDESTWDANGTVKISKKYGTIDSDGYGTININNNSVLNCIGGLIVGSKGTINIDNGVLNLRYDSYWGGTLSVSPNGGEINVVVGSALAGSNTVKLSDSLNFTNGTITIAFEPGFVENPSETYDLFDPINSADLSAILATADTLITPPGWILDTSTGILSYLTFQDCLQGPEVSATPNCQDTHDYDSDGDVDLEDFAEYQRIFAD